MTTTTEIPHGVSPASTNDKACAAMAVSGHKEARGNASFRDVTLPLRRKAPGGYLTIRSLPQRCLPVGISRCHAATPWGSAAGRVCRTPGSVELLLEGPGLPDLRFHEAAKGLVRLEVRRTPTGSLQSVMVGTLLASARGDGRLGLQFGSLDGTLVDLVLTL